MSKDSLGDRMKDYYEKRSQSELLRRMYTLIRVDGKAFHTFTKDFDRPYDTGLMSMMDQTAQVLCKEIQGAKCAFVQSDEITIVITDFDTLQTDAWFDYNVQKMTSVSASIATVAFNRAYLQSILDTDWPRNELLEPKWACFDSRVWQAPSRNEAINALIWRQQDATRNSLQMATRAHFSHKEVDGKNTADMHEMLFQQKNVNWDKYPAGFKRGRFVMKEEFELPMNEMMGMTPVKRSRWAIVEPPIFSQERQFFDGIIPYNEASDDSSSEGTVCGAQDL